MRTRTLQSIARTALVMLFLAGPLTARADEMLALYGLKGYAYTYSPLVTDGLHVQAGVMYSYYQEWNLECRDGFIWFLPVSLTYGDGDWWEVSAGMQWEYWKNTDFNVDESGVGDLFLGGKFRLLGQDRKQVMDLSLMPYVFFPTGDHDKSIGDLYLFNPTEEDDYPYGLNLLAGRRWGRVYASLNLGINYIDSSLPYIENSTFFYGLTAEYQVSETLNTYIEFMNNENKNHFQCPACGACYDEDTDQDIREIGAGLVWLKNKWGFKFHAGVGLSETAPDFRVIGLVNFNLGG